MTAKPLRKKIVALAVAVLAVIAGYFVLSGKLTPEPSYQGKSVKVWFEEYAHFTMILGVTNLISHESSGRVIRNTHTMARIPDPAWEALRALGSNAVPHLIRRLPVGPFDSPGYKRFVTILPQKARPLLPDPWLRKWIRSYAVEALGDLGSDARAAIPALLEALKHTELSESSSRGAIITALHRAGVDPSAIAAVMLELGSQLRYAEVVEIAWVSGWKGPEVARLLGECLRSPDPNVRRDAMKLLENSGSAAAPALDQVLQAMKDSEEQIRYRAACLVEKIGTNSPPTVEALQTALGDENAMVRRVAYRTLLKIAPKAIPPDESVSVEKR